LKLKGPQILGFLSTNETNRRKTEKALCKRNCTFAQNIFLLFFAKKSLYSRAQKKVYVGAVFDFVLLRIKLAHRFEKPEPDRSMAAKTIETSYSVLFSVSFLLIRFRMNTLYVGMFLYVGRENERECLMKRSLRNCELEPLEVGVHFGHFLSLPQQ